MKKSAVLINYSKEGFLCASRRNSDEFCFIGGKFEDGETPIEALIRETKEESGIDILEEQVKLVNIVEIFGYEAYIFFSNIENLKPYQVEDEIVPYFKNKEELLSDLATFKEFNKSFFDNFFEITTWYKENTKEKVYNHFEYGYSEVNKPKPLNIDFKLQKDWKSYNWIKKETFLIYNKII